MPKGRAAKKETRFNEKLVLHQFVLSLLGARTLEQLGDEMKKDPNMELLDEEGRTRFHHVILAKLPEGSPITREKLRTYDENIVRHTNTISQRRPERVRWKYFQYLALLFTEIYLDLYFLDGAALRDAVDRARQRFNEEQDEEEHLSPYEQAELSKICYWMATGSGKTLIMHINILQYHHYLHFNKKRHELNRVILLTPNEGLSRQHLDDLQQSGFGRAEIFQKDVQLKLPNLGDTPTVQIIDIHKLEEKEGDKTVAIEAFEGNNLVLVDEGHLGASGDDWMQKRDRLCRDGFSFEYSATFGQAMKASKKKPLSDRYAKAILFDYSYRFFYADGHGKNYWIMNLPDDSNKELRKTYLAACLMTFYQQQRIYFDYKSDLLQYRLEAPLLVFVGGTVTKKLSTREGSDIVETLQFLADFALDEEKVTERITKLLSGKSEILDGEGNDVFGHAFPYLVKLGLKPQTVYRDLLARFFNSTGPGILRVELLKGSGGELGLRIGSSEYFGVINVGDGAALKKLCEEHKLSATDREFSESLFASIQEPSSKIQLLIGSKKFTEGWNSFRVSTMGLMNVGKSEGPQIIQLFGRGVRLRGMNGGLKRSAATPGAPRYLKQIETLGIFGVQADYMKQFKEYLEEEGVPSDNEPQEIELKTEPNLKFEKLNTLTIDNNVDFDRDVEPFQLGAATKPMRDLKVKWSWYPKLDAMKSAGIKDTDVARNLENGYITHEHTAFVDWQAVFFELERYKAERGYDKLYLSPAELESIILDSSWYELQAPPADLKIDSMEKAQRLQELIASLLKRYADRFYKVTRDGWERKHLRLVKLKPTDANVSVVYKFLIDASREDILTQIKELERRVKSGEMKDLYFAPLQAIMFGQHIYRPLIHLDGDGMSVSPVALNEGERDFVVDLRAFFEANPDFFKGKELFVLRNLSRGKGIGFFEAGNFHPDFILWLVDGKTQHIVFVDPKGVTHMSEDHDKIMFYQKVKQLEKDFAGQDATFDSFIVSVTSYAKISTKWSLSKEELAARHVLFQLEDKATYIRTILETALKSKTVAASI